MAALLESGWVTMDMVPEIPVVADRPEMVIYGPLAETPVDPDVVLIRVNGKQLMVLADALPGLRIDGKPQCHIVAVAKQQGEVAVSVGCMLSRTRTGMRSEEMSAPFLAADCRTWSLGSKRPRRPTPSWRRTRRRTPAASWPPSPS